MKEQYVRDLIEGASVDSLFALRSRDLRSARSGEAYLALEIGDCTGRMPAVMFRPAASDQAVPAGSVIRLRGTVTTYRGVRRVAVESLRPEAFYEREDLLPSGVRERSELLADLRGLVRRIRHRGLRSVVNEVFGSPGFVERFASCPGARAGHHAYIGGLLEHTVSVGSICLSLVPAYPQIDVDILLAAALLHDVGKVEDLAFETTVDRTDAGRLMGHVALGERMVSRAVDRLGDAVPDDVALRLCHAVLSHGESSGGSPRQPCTLEALVLRHADRLDAEVAAFADAVSGAAVLDERWTDAANAFARPLLVPGPTATAAVATRCA